MASPVTSKQIVLRTVETLLIASCGGAVFVAMRFPAGLVAGAMLSVAAAALIGRPVMMPPPLSRVVLILVGISLGAAITPETLHGLATFPVSIAMLTVASVCMMLATAAYLRSVHGWSAQDAVFGASPGALAQVMALAAEQRADLPAIAIVQVMRVVLLTIGIPAGLALFGLNAANAVLAPNATNSIGELALVVLVSSACALTLAWLRFPGGLLFGAMVGSGLLHGSGLLQTALPPWVVSAAVIGIGALTGSRFANTDPRTLMRYIGAALGSFAVAGLIASTFVLGLTTFMAVRIADAVVAFSPGAQDTMMVVALSLHLDPIYVGAHHLWRFLLVSLSLPFQVQRASKQ